MNKIINDLCEHADFYVGNEHYDKSHEEKQRLFMEKFASLIIDDILSICEEKGDSGLDGHYCADEIARKYK